MRLSITAPAKVNLFLDVLHKRPDGYHNIGTVFQTLDFGDELLAELAPQGQITVTSTVQVCEKPEQDLIYRAALALKEAYHIKEGVHFWVNKRLPMGAGLGGGSSDAASALRLCCELWGIPWDVDALIPIAAKLGADVPFFLAGGTAFAEGIGEELSWVDAFEELESKWVLVMTPHAFVPTGKAYGSLRPSGEERWQDFQQGLREGRSWADLAYNKFEEWVLAEFEEIAQLKSGLLAAGADFALLSGSGASVFAVYDQEAEADAALAQWQEKCRFSKKMKFLSQKALTFRYE